MAIPIGPGAPYGALSGWACRRGGCRGRIGIPHPCPLLGPYRGMPASSHAGAGMGMVHAGGGGYICRGLICIGIYPCAYPLSIAFILSIHLMHSFIGCIHPACMVISLCPCIMHASLMHRDIDRVDAFLCMVLSFPIHAFPILFRLGWIDPINSLCVDSPHCPIWMDLRRYEPPGIIIRYVRFHPSGPWSREAVLENQKR